MSRIPIPASWFRRLKFRVANGRHAGILGFIVRFPGTTPPDARRWLKAHGYVYGSGRAWSREDRKPTRMTRSQADVHADLVRSRRRRRGLGRPDCGANSHDACSR